MERIMVQAKKVMDEKGKNLTLYYWLLSRRVQDAAGLGITAYGVETAQYDGELLLDKECVDCISFEKANILAFIKRIAKGNATPVTLLPLIDDFISLQEMVD